jgi:predicted nucleic acid-binding protein
MTGYNKVFLDTTPLIYFLDNDINFGIKSKNIFENILSNQKEIVTSAITVNEYLVYPYRTGNHEKINALYDFISDCGIKVYPITVEIADKAARIRAEYTSFKGMDALQLAAACNCGCDVFLTNDKQLKQFNEVKCITVEEWNID